ncbi:MAG TPA: hypothetical protein VLI90_08180 [Tepidisphaeraceae bacterium]|nr:hypothetical protein [Tepidisphaeraceae bacterium]
MDNQTTGQSTDNGAQQDKGGFNLGSFVQQVSAFVSATAPIVDAGVGIALPELAPAIDAGTKILQGVLAEEPAAKALYDQIKSGETPTADQIAAIESSYEADYQQLKADIAAAKAAQAT